MGLKVGSVTSCYYCALTYRSAVVFLIWSTRRISRIDFEVSSGCSACSMVIYCLAILTSSPTGPLTWLLFCHLVLLEPRPPYTAEVSWSCAPAFYPAYRSFFIAALPFGDAYYDPPTALLNNSTDLYSPPPGIPVYPSLPRLRLLISPRLLLRSLSACKLR